MSEIDKLARQNSPSQRTKTAGTMQNKLGNGKYQTFGFQAQYSLYFFLRSRIFVNRYWSLLVFLEQKEIEKNRAGWISIGQQGFGGVVNIQVLLHEWEIREHEVTTPATANGRERGNRTNVNCEGGRGGQIWFGWLIDFSSPNLPTNHIYLHF